MPAGTVKSRLVAAPPSTKEKRLSAAAVVEILRGKPPVGAPCGDSSTVRVVLLELSETLSDLLSALFVLKKALLSLGSIVSVCVACPLRTKPVGAARVKSMVSASSISESSSISMVKRGFSPAPPGRIVTGKLSTRALPLYVASLKAPVIPIVTARPLDGMVYPSAPISTSMTWLPASSKTEDDAAAKPMGRVTSSSMKVTVCVAVPNS